MIDLIREFLFGPVEALPRAGAAEFAAAVAFAERAVEDERRRIAAERAERERAEAERGECPEHDGLIRYKTRFPIDPGILECARHRHVKPDLRAAVLSFPARLLTYVKEKCGGDGRVAYTRSHVSKQIYSRIISWDDSHADKKTVMKFCLGLRLDVDEAERLLKSAGYAFSGTIPLDRVVIYAIEQGIHNIDDVNEILRRASLPPLD